LAVHLLTIPKADIPFVNFDDIKYDDGFIDDEHFWVLFPTKPLIFEPVRQVLAAKRSWNKDIIQLGDLEKS
jgi:hypothetical protein